MGPRYETYVHILDRRGLARDDLASRRRCEHSHEDQTLDVTQPMEDDRPSQLAELGAALWRAEVDRAPIPQVSAGRPWIGQAEAYVIQQEGIGRAHV